MGSCAPLIIKTFFNYEKKVILNEGEKISPHTI